jgi:hypothetical protein
MTELSGPTLTVIAYALLTHRNSHSQALAYWQGSSDPFAQEIAAAYIAELATIDNALREFQTAAPPLLSDFLKQQIDLIHPTTASPQPSTQEAT